MPNRRFLNMLLPKVCVMYLDVSVSVLGSGLFPPGVALSIFAVFASLKDGIFTAFSSERAAPSS